jgi:parvulin-like peptidyl-prolyl isomerase
MNMVIDYAYVDEIAKKRHITVTDGELNDAIRLVRSQNRLGSNNQVFEDVLKEFWGWSVNDFKRELRQQMLEEKVVSTLDTGTHDRAKGVYAQLATGADFATVAKQTSDDLATRDNGGDYGYTISQSDRNLPPEVIDTLFKLKVGETSPIISTGTGLEIIKLNQKDGDKVQASHISFNFKPITTYTNSLRDKNKPKIFISQ